MVRPRSWANFSLSTAVFRQECKAPRASFGANLTPFLPTRIIAQADPSLRRSAPSRAARPNSSGTSLGTAPHDWDPPGTVIGAQGIFTVVDPCGKYLLGDPGDILEGPNRAQVLGVPGGRAWHA
jgi:hypothetical protein